jgi:hypothetical protein
MPVGVINNVRLGCAQNAKLRITLLGVDVTGGSIASPQHAITGISLMKIAFHPSSIARSIVYFE